jgi:diguanylate cyclase (GGDEF)-like protein/PAS domain S-box-containing protein
VDNGVGAGVTSLSAHLHRLETIFRAAPMGIGIVHPDGHLLMSNETLRLLLGYSADEFARMSWIEYTHPDDVPRNLELNRQMTAGEIDSFTLEKRFVRKDGSLLWTELTSSMVRDAAGAPDYLIGMVQDISERKRLARELRTAENQFRMLVERVPAVVYSAEAGADGRWHYVSPQVEQMLGFTAAQWQSEPGLWIRQVHPDDRAMVLAADEPTLSPDGEVATQSTAYRMRHRDGSVVWVRDDAITVPERDTAVWHGMLVDVTREKRLEERLGHQAYHDSLTGLPNRTLFHERVGRALARAGRHPGDVGVLFVDLDEFKTVNDTFGHAYGDEVIVTAAERIRSCVDQRDTAARLGGDEFGLLLEGATLEQAEALATRVLQVLRDTPIRLGDLTVTVGASVGIALAAPDESTDTLLRNADLAMYQAKHSGRGRHFHYHPGLHESVVQRFQIEEALQVAVTEERITLAYQPIVDIGSGQVVGLEALARWTDPELGPVPPGDFIPVAERTGLIRDIGGRVIRDACRGLAKWRRDTGVDAYVSVNVSPPQLDAAYPGDVDRALRESGLPPSALLLEVTEGLLLSEASRASIRDLRSRGIRVAIDDFGTGFSSLAYLRELPVDMVKIDQLFLRPGPEGGDDHTLLEALSRLARSLQLVTVFEGVETPEQLELLESIGCRYAQGYLFRRPGPLDQVPGCIELVAARGDRALF